MTGTSDFLIHYGVPGMKWGVVKEDDPVSVRRRQAISSYMNSPQHAEAQRRGMAEVKKYGPHTDAVRTGKFERKADLSKTTSSSKNSATSPNLTKVLNSPIKTTGNVTLQRKTDRSGSVFYGKGNIDLNNRQVVRNKDGTISTERSFSVNIDGKEVLLPTVINGKIVDEDTAIDHYYKTGEHLGKFDTVKEAEEYAEKLHERQDRYYNELLKNGKK